MSLVRVQHKTTGHQYTVGANKAATDKDLTILDRPAVDINGNALPPKPRTTLPSKPDANLKEPK